MPSDRFEPTPHTRVRRQAGRAAYDRATVHAVFDAAPFCHVGIVADDRPVVIPTLHARVGDRLLLHGAPASRLLRVAAAADRVCVTATLYDGLVLARSVFEHSINYRSAVAFGPATPIEDPEAKLEALAAFTEKLIPGRWDDARQPTTKEMRATAVAAVEIEEASAKIRTGPPEDADADLGLEVWAGVIPFGLTPGAPLPAPDLADGIELPGYLRDLLQP